MTADGSGCGRMQSANVFVMGGFAIPSIVLAVVVTIVSFLVSGWIGAVVAVAAGLFLVSRTMGWISLLMMHMGPGDDATNDNSFYEPLWARLLFLTGITVPALVLLWLSPLDSRGAATSSWFLGIASTMLLVFRPLDRGCLVQWIGLSAAVGAGIAALFLRLNGYLGTAQLVLWFISGAGMGLLIRRPVGDDPV